MPQQGFSQVVWLLVWSDAVLVGWRGVAGPDRARGEKFFEDQALMKDGVLTVEEL